MQVGKIEILYFKRYVDCFITYDLIMEHINYPNYTRNIKWDFPFETNHGYGIVYRPELDNILDIDNYEMRIIDSFDYQST